MHTQSFPTFVSPWTVAHQAPLSMGLSRQEYSSGLPFPPPEDLANQEIKPASPALAGKLSLFGKPLKKKKKKKLGNL